MANLSVVVVDDHDLFRRGLVGVIERAGLVVAGEAGDAERAAELVATARPDVVLVDLRLPRVSGIEVTRRLRGTGVTSKVVVVTASIDPADVDEALAAGADGYLVKSAPPEEIVAGIRAAAAGGFPVSPHVARAVLERARGKTGPAPAGPAPALSGRELEVLRLLADGRDNAQIAETLFITPRTVRHHVSSIMIKLEAENRTQAATRAVRYGLI